MLLDITVEDENRNEKHIVVSMNKESLKQLKDVVEISYKKMKILDKEYHR